ncbi:type VII secretion-associated protein [Rhodococcus zopfii]|uniref:Type VII secretion-associated protein n=1 Tax=Rhodococcus zopfii TaxID=43772 RepID=A0ABU3WL98_9NOCA|nr:type VII secretion-associated protein [Rhodococcus zopfii]
MAAPGHGRATQRARSGRGRGPADRGGAQPTRRRRGRGGGLAAVLERRAAERGGVVRDVDADTTFGDRSVIAYTEVPEEFSTVRWFVVVDRGWQVAVGCQFLVGEWSGIGKECEQAVHTLVVR